MKLTNWFVEKFGTDKMLHFLGGALMVSVPSPFGWWGILVGFIMMLGLSFIKEQCFDSTFDKRDIIAATLGGIVSIILYVIIRLFI